MSTSKIDTLPQQTSYPSEEVSGPPAQGKTSPRDQQPRIMPVSSPFASAREITQLPSYASAQAQTGMPFLHRARRQTPTPIPSDATFTPTVVDPAADGLPDLTRLPSPTDKADFHRQTIAYWDTPIPNHSDFVSPRLQQELRLNQNLRDEADVRFHAGLLSAQAKDLVHEYVTRRPEYMSLHGAYALQVGSADQQHSGPLAGAVILTKKPAGYSYTKGRVTAGAQNTGPTVLYMPGRNGMMREFPSLKDALDGVNAGLQNDPMFRAELSARQSPQDRASLQMSTAPSIHATLLALKGKRTMAESMVQRQIDAWEANAQAKSPQWNDARGLDVSRSDDSRWLQLDNDNRLKILPLLPRGLRNMPPADAMKLQKLRDQQQLHSEQAEAYYGKVPDFASYADQRIRAAIASDTGVTLDPSKITITVTYEKAATFSGKPPGVSVPTHTRFSETYSLRDYIAQQIPNRSILSLPGKISGPPIIRGSHAEVLNAPYVERLVNELELERDYARQLHRTFDEPADPANKPAFDAARLASQQAAADKIRVDALIALHTGDLDKRSARMVQHILDHPDAGSRPLDGYGKRVNVSGLVLNGHSMRDIALFNREGEPNIVVHTPQAPDGKLFRAYPNRRAFFSDLRQQIASMKRPRSEWTPQALYWAGQFGAHQQPAVTRLKQIAAKPSSHGTLLQEAPIQGNFFQTQLAHRTRYLLAEADASACTDNEATLQNALEWAEFAYRIGSTFLPAWIAAPLDLGELGCKLFQGFSALGEDRKEDAANYIVDAISVGLSSGPNLAGFRFRSKNGALARPQLEVVRTPGNRSPQVAFQSIASPSVQSNKLRSLSAGKYQGLYYEVIDGRPRMYAKLDDGKYYEAYVGKHRDGSEVVRLGISGPTARHHFQEIDPILIRDPTSGRWTPQARLISGLRGGMWQPPLQTERRSRLPTVENRLGHYDPQIETFYPLRDSGNRPLYIKAIPSQSLLSESGKTYPAASILPYVNNSRLTKGYVDPPENLARRDLYEEKIESRMFNDVELEKLPESEREGLRGQSAVFAKREIKKGEIIGIYSGQITNNTLAGNNPFKLDVYPENSKVLNKNLTMVGDNIMSKMNSIFIFDNKTRTWSQAKTGYNVEPATFNVTVDGYAPKDPEPTYRLVAFYATDDIPADTELRWNYHYDSRQIARLISGS
jgi:hypothetical protein